LNGIRIFISYQRDDQKLALDLYDRLISDRYWVWIDKEGLEPAKEWEPQIDENLRQSQMIVVLISSHSVGSDWVKHEGSMAFALNQSIIPVQIEEFGTYTASDLPIWVGKLQLHSLILGSSNYEDHYAELKQLLGTPLPIRKHLIQALRPYKEAGVLLDEVALTLVVRHYHELNLTPSQKIVADQLIEDSRLKFEKIWNRYDKLNGAYKLSRTEGLEMKQVIRSLHSAKVLREYLLVMAVLALLAIVVLVLYFYYQSWIQLPF
jgi:hypothetical protein